MTSYTYNTPHGLLKQSMEYAGPGGNYQRIVDFTYDAKNIYVASATTKVGRMVSGAFTSGTTTLAATFVTDLRHGKTTKATDPNGKATTSTYDSRGRLLTRTGPDNVVLESNVYADTFPVGVTTTLNTDVGKSFQRYTHLDADEHVLSVTEGVPGETTWSRKSKFRYDAFGRSVESYRPAFVAGIYGGRTPSAGPKDVTSYDGFGRTILVTSADATSTASAYEPRDVTETDERGVTAVRSYDAFGNLASVTRAPGFAEASTHSFVRDGRGAIVKVTDGDGSVRRLERDRGGRLRYVTLPGQPGTTPARFSMCHGLDDRLVRMESPAGRVVSITHDELGRVLQTIATDATGLTVEASQIYDQGVAGGLGLGRLTSKTDESGVYNLSYDAYGRPKTLSFAPSSRARAGATNVAATYGATFVYTPIGALTSVNFTGLPVAQAASLAYARDNRGRVSTITTKQGTTTTTLAADFLFEADDKIKRARYGNGTSAEWTFNPLTERLDRVAYLNAAGATLAAVGYQYDPAGNPTREDREKDGGLYSQKFHVYDPLNRLASSEAFLPGGASQYESNAFSPSGNIMVQGWNTYSYNSPVSSQAVSQVADIFGDKLRDLAYDADGYLSTDYETRADGATSSRTIAFDPTGCMRSITREDSTGGNTSSAASEYTCGLDNKVVARDTTKPDGSHSRRIDFAGLAEIRPDEGVFMIRVPVSGSVSVEDARSLATGARVTSMSAYLMNDARGSVLATTGFATAGLNFTAEVEYDAWGKKLEGYSAMASPRHGFAGAEPDEAVGTYSFGARTYDPSLRRWVSPDPLLAAVPALDEALADNLNLYSYVGNNPVRRTDLSGFEGDSWTDRLRSLGTGVVQGLAEATVPGGMVVAALTPRAENRDAALGRAAGHAIGGAVSVVSGVQGVAGSVGLGVGSGGTATPVVTLSGVYAAAQVANGAVAIAAAVGELGGRGPSNDGAAQATETAPKPSPTPDARFVSQPDGQVVDTHATPRGSYSQPNGGRTDILQAEDHGAGLSHTHDPQVNTNPKTGQQFVNGLAKPGRPVSPTDVRNIQTGAAPKAEPKGR